MLLGDTNGLVSFGVSLGGIGYFSDFKVTIIKSKFEAEF